MNEKQRDIVSAYLKALDSELKDPDTSPIVLQQIIENFKTNLVGFYLDQWNKGPGSINPPYDNIKNPEYLRRLKAFVTLVQRQLPIETGNMVNPRLDYEALKYFLEEHEEKQRQAKIAIIAIKQKYRQYLIRLQMQASLALEPEKTNLPGYGQNPMLYQSALIETSQKVAKAPAALRKNPGYVEKLTNDTWKKSLAVTKMERLDLGLPPNAPDSLVKAVKLLATPDVASLPQSQVVQAQTNVDLLKNLPNPPAGLSLKQAIETTASETTAVYQGVVARSLTEAVRIYNDPNTPAEQRELARNMLNQAVKLAEANAPQMVTPTLSGKLQPPGVQIYRTPVAPEEISPLTPVVAVAFDQRFNALTVVLVDVNTAISELRKTGSTKPIFEGLGSLDVEKALATYDPNLVVEFKVRLHELGVPDRMMFSLLALSQESPTAINEVSTYQKHPPKLPPGGGPTTMPGPRESIPPTHPTFAPPGLLSYLSAVSTRAKQIYSIRVPLQVRSAINYIPLWLRRLYEAILASIRSPGGAAPGAEPLISVGMRTGLGGLGRFFGSYGAAGARQLAGAGIRRAAGGITTNILRGATTRVATGLAGLVASQGFWVAMLILAPFAFIFFSNTDLNETSSFVTETGRGGAPAEYYEEYEYLGQLPPNSAITGCPTNIGEITQCPGGNYSHQALDKKPIDAYDISAGLNTVVRATHNGYVAKYAEIPPLAIGTHTNGYGNYVRLVGTTTNTSNQTITYYTTYAHLAGYSSRVVEAAACLNSAPECPCLDSEEHRLDCALIKTGEEIGRVDNTGRSDGNHLHYQYNEYGGSTRLILPNCGYTGLSCP